MMAHARRDMTGFASRSYPPRHGISLKRAQGRIARDFGEEFDAKPKSRVLLTSRH